VLGDGQLASGSSDKSIRIWNLADNTQLAKLEGHTESVNCLTALADGRLASSARSWTRQDKTIRVRAVVPEAIGKIAGCDSTFDFEEAARGFTRGNGLGDLFAAVVQQFDEKIGGLSASAGITAQANVFDAIAKVITADDNNAALVDGLLGLVRDENLLPDMKRRGVSDAAIEKLAPTALFRVVLDAKYAAGPRFLLFVECLSFIVVMCCYARIAAFEVLGWSDPWLLVKKSVEKTAALLVAFALLAYFFVREVSQMKTARDIELAQPEKPLRKAKGLAWYALAVPRYGLLLVMLVPLLLFALVCKVLVKLSLLDEDSKWNFIFSDFKTTRKYGFENTWFGINVSRPILHDPLTYLGLPRAWRGDYWNWIDAVALGCAWAVFVRAGTPGIHLSTHHAAATAMLLWLRLFGFMKNINQSLATFILMFERIVRDLRVFMLFFLMIMLMFGSAFYLYLGQHEAEAFGFHDDGAPNSFESAKMTMFSLLLLAFVGDYDLDNYPRPADRGYLVLFLVVIVIVQLNILIAIVSDSYDAAMAKSEALYYRANLELVTETAWVAKCFPKRLLPMIDEAWIKKRLVAALEENEDGDDPGRTVDITRRVQRAVHADTRRAVAELEDRMNKRMDASLDARFDEVLQILRARPA